MKYDLYTVINTNLCAVYFASSAWRFACSLDDVHCMSDIVWGFNNLGYIFIAF